MWALYGIMVCVCAGMRCLCGVCVYKFLCVCGMNAMCVACMCVCDVYVYVISVYVVCV